jgi:hypothetical protein
VFEKSGDRVEVDQQAQADAEIRNAVEGRFGQGKRRFSLGGVMAKLAHSAETAIAIIFLVMTLERYIQSMTLFFGAILATVVWPSRATRGEPAGATQVRGWLLSIHSHPAALLHRYLDRSNRSLFQQALPRSS